MEQGNHVIVLINGNSYMKASNLSIALQALTLREVILERHGTKGLATHKRNSTKCPIDGIWATPGIKIVGGGYFQYDEVFTNTDHRCLWVDLTYEMAFGAQYGTLE
jgi:hypothetical protein